ncbi:hypothetical protein KIPB_003101 [Kipferlia bialata]|uniref:PDEase domain-containing protein n=1 Tax=Kipferlia bialata TaxID=797122 RepID=A0A9K3CTX5_9EUKA|nr:hypothetical protein KIPB_003101 [Kipferlia bialata]|eukprot:g3101.t1
MLAAVGMDMDHPGVAEDYLVASDHPLSVMHGRKNPIRNQAAALTAIILAECGVYKASPGTVAFICSLIKATHQSKLKATLFGLRSRQQQRPSAGIYLGSQQEEEAMPSALANPSGDVGHIQTLIAQAVVITASHAHTIRPWMVARRQVAPHSFRFGHSLMQEEFDSGDLEAAAGFIVPARHRREGVDPEVTTSVCQAMLIERTALPLLKGLSGYCRRLGLARTSRLVHKLAERARDNMERWRQSRGPSWLEDKALEKVLDTRETLAQDLEGAGVGPLGDVVE